MELHAALDAGRGRVVAEGVLEEVGGALLDEDRPEMARLLPEWLGSVVARGAFRGDIGADGLYRRVAARFGVDVGRAVEVTKLACAAVAHGVDEDLVAALRRHLPASIGELFVDRPHEADRPLPEHRERPLPGGEGRTLATGKAGSHHPVSESAPGHRDSVARSSDPHGDSKLSSSRGLLQERNRETLATGRSGSKHPVSEDD